MVRGRMQQARACHSRGQRDEVELILDAAIKDLYSMVSVVLTIKPSEDRNAAKSREASSEGGVRVLWHMHDSPTLASLGVRLVQTKSRGIPSLTQRSVLFARVR